MDATTTHSNIPTAPVIPMLARTGTAIGGAVVHRVRPAPVLINPIIAPASPIAVVVRRSYTNPARVRITLRASGRVLQAATLTRTMNALSGNIRLFTARTGGSELTFTQSTTNADESTRTIPPAELNGGGKVLFVQADSPSSGLSEYRLRLSLAGPTAGPPTEVTIVAVLLTLDISPPRSVPGPTPAPLPQPPDPRPAPGTATDKWFGGLQLNSQDTGNHQKRAELQVSITPGNFNGVLRLRQVVVSGDNVGALDTKVQLFENESPGPSGTPPVPETPLGNNFEFPSASASPLRRFFVQGATGSRTLRDTGFQLGLKDVEDDGDRVAITVVIAPVLTVDSPIVVVKLPHTSPARRVLTVRASSTFGRTGTLTRAAGGPAIRVFNPAGTEILDLGAGHTVTAADLSAGLQLSVESTARSGAANDIGFTLTLAPGTGAGAVPVGAASTITLTAVELKLDVGLIRPAPGAAPPLMSDTDKVNQGRFIQLRTPRFTHKRAMIVLRPPNPNVTLTVRLESLNTQVEAFGLEEPAAGQGAHPRPATFPNDVIGNRMELFVEGVTPSATVLETGFRYGIDGLENECDRVAFTVLPDPSVAGPFPVGEREYTRAAPLSIPSITETLSALTLSDFNLPAGAANQTNIAFSAAIHALVRYPAVTAGVDQDVSRVFPRYPLIVIAHGNHDVVDSAGNPVESFRGLEYLCRHFASYGYIAISVDLDPLNTVPNPDPTAPPGAVIDTFPGIVQRGLIILEHIAFWGTLNASDPKFTGKVDLSQVGLIGHSRGGEAVVSAQKTNVDQSRGVNIKSIISISQTDFLGITHSSTPYLVIYGSADGDVSLGWPFRMYDRAAPFKSLIWVYGAIHNRFSTSPDWLARLDPDPPEPRAISAPDHLNIARGYCLGFMEFVIRNFSDHLPLFKENGRPSTVPAAVEIFHQVQERPPKLIVDNFEQGAFNPANPVAGLDTRATTNTLGLNVTHANLVVPRPPFTNALTEASLRNRELNLAGSNDFFWNDTFGAILAWDAVGARYTQNLGTVDVSSFKVLSFRVTQRFGSNRNPNPGPSPDFSVTLGDTNAQNAQVRVGSVATIPFPWTRTDNIRNSAGVVIGTTTRFQKSAFVTIRIPLATFINANTNLNLSSLRVVIFRFDQTARGEIAIDDLEFSN